MPKSTINRAHVMHYYLEDITVNIKDGRGDYYYYSCDPFAIYSTTDVVDVNELLSLRDSQENNFILWLATEFYKLGDYEFVKVWEGNSVYETGYFERLCKKCKRQKISYMDFCWSLATNANDLDSDVLYIVYCNEE